MRFFPVGQSGHGVKVYPDGSARCTVCDERGGNIGAIAARYHVARHRELDRDGGPPTGFGSYGWSKRA